MSSAILSTPKLGLREDFKVKGYVHWELIDSTSGKIVETGKGRVEERSFIHRIPYSTLALLPSRLQAWAEHFFPLGTENAIVDHARNQLATAMIGTAVTYPSFVAVGTGTTAVGASQTGLVTVSQYDGANDAKAAASRTLKGQFTSRIVTQFDTDEANVTIRELGLFEANDASTNMWARVRVTIAKTSSNRLNIYWYILFERRAGVAIKSGASIGATGTVTSNTDITLNFASAVTIVVIHNNSGVRMYVKFNAALTGSPPTDYDFILEDGQTYMQSEEEIEISTVHVYMDDAITMPDNKLVVRGW
tara:strand:- start:377 stop:1291 length:915 start_codon:yes stop_codon:yes gene_type:complete